MSVYKKGSVIAGSDVYKNLFKIP